MKEWQILSKEIFHSLLSLSRPLLRDILMPIPSILIRNYCMPLVCANSSCIITEDELIFQASICVTQIRQGLFAKGWPCFLAGLPGGAVPDSLQWIARGFSWHIPGTAGTVTVTAAAPRPGVDKAPPGIFSGYWRLVGNKYSQAWVCILLVLQI